MRGPDFREWAEIDKVRNNKRQLKAISVDKKAQEKTGSDYVYQYRTMESFWPIIESDSFWATNARFSNDHEEQKLGMRKIKEILGEDGKIKNVGSPGDYYIVCFCDEDDKLSQWRGYAQEGVSIGFDFMNVRPFYVKKRNEDAYICVYNSCYKVQYIQQDTNKNEFAYLFDLDLSNDPNNYENIRNQAQDIIPYVKHIGFHEETESRLVFSNKKDTDLSECIHYRNIGNIKVPYIVVKAGNKEDRKRKKCIVRLNFQCGEGKKLKEKMETDLAKKNLRNLEIINCADMDEPQLDDRVCFGCTLRNAYIPNVNGCNPRCRYACKSDESFHIKIRNEIYISDSRNQELIYNGVYDFLKNEGKEKSVKIWCDGHLPIRSITVGNLKNKEIVAESIRHYCDQHYWLRSVDVKSSDTPFRSSLI